MDQALTASACHTSVILRSCGAGKHGLARCLIRCARDEDCREDLAAAVAGRGWGLRELRFERVTLEKVFQELTGGEGGE